MRKRKRLVALGGILLLYFGLSLYQLNLPGLHYDEAFEAVPALQLLQAQPITTFREHGLKIGGHIFPLMTQDYIGAINTYLVIPFLAILGPTPAALRVMSIVTGAITIWLTYALAGQLTRNHWVGLAAALLLAVDPTFVFWNRQGIFVTAVTAPIGLAATLCWLWRWRGGSRRWSLAGAFLFGLGLYAKLLFVWLMAALVGAVILLNLSPVLRFMRGLLNTNELFQKKWPFSVQEVGRIACAFLLGCWPLLVYNLQTHGTFLSVSGNAATSYYGVNNLAFGANLWTRLAQFLTMQNGTHLWYLGNIRGTSLPVFGLSVFLFLVAFLAIRNIILSPSFITLSLVKIAIFPYLVISLVVLGSIGTVSALWVTHFALLMPWPAIALTVAGWYLFPYRPHLRFLASSIFPIGLCLLVGANLFTTLRYHVSLAESGGLSSHSDAIYDLSDWLAHNAAGPVAAMDWGLAAPVTYLTAGRVTPVEVFGYAWESDQDLTTRLQALIARPTTLYLWRAPDEIIFDRSAEFKALYRPLHLEEDIEEAFYERSGRPLLGITRLVKRGTAQNPPQ
ncbi:MAG: glycosyltransferase family 39 protein [Anaerolineae bacterium]|nr:glycosyltransferase family 39 protein [Anaerolineae bacterium]